MKVDAECRMSGLFFDEMWIWVLDLFMRFLRLSLVIAVFRFYLRVSLTAVVRVGGSASTLFFLLLLNRH